MKGLLFSWPVALLVLVVAYFLASAAFNMYERYQITRSNYEQVKRQLTEAENRRGALEALVAESRSPQGREALLREKFDVAKEGEQVIIIIDSEKKEEVVSEEEGSFWSWLSGMF